MISLRPVSARRRISELDETIPEGIMNGHHETRVAPALGSCMRLLHPAHPS